MKRIKRARRTPVEAAQANEHQRRSSTYYGLARRRWIGWAADNQGLPHPKQRHLTGNPEDLAGSLLLLGSPALTKSNAAPQTALVSAVKFVADPEWFPTNEEDGSTFPGWVVTLTGSNPAAQAQLLGLYATAFAIRQTATMDDVTARANFRWGVYPNPDNETWWVCLEERREDGSFGYAETWKVPELREKNVNNKFQVLANNPGGSVTIPLGFLLGALDGLNPNSTDTQEAAAADPAAQAAHAEGFRLLTPGTQQQGAAA